MSENKNTFYAYLEGWLSIALNLLLFGLKYWAGVASGSVAIIADAWHTLTDSISSIIVIFGAKAASKPPDQQHPFGHGRSELIAALLIGVLLALVSFNFVLDAVQNFISHEEAHFGNLAIGVTVFSILVKELMAQFAFWTARKTNSASLKADGWHHRSDAISSVVILVGIFVGKFLWWADAALALIVAGIIGHAAFNIFKETTSAILGENLKLEEIEELKVICNETAGYDVNAHNILLHNYVTRKDISMHVHLAAGLSFQQAHSLTKQIEEQVGQRFGARVTVHADLLD